MSRRQYDVFIGAYIRANGTEYGGTRRAGTAIVYGRPGILDELQALSVQQDVSASIGYDKRTGAPRLNLCHRATADVAQPPTIEHYSGKVWCLRVPMSNFMVRHNGIAHFTGNSWEHGEAILSLISDDSVYIPGWEAKVNLRAAGDSWKVHAAHDFKGSSIWNKAHGALRTSLLVSDAELYVSGHRHDWVTQSFERSGKGTVAHLAMVRGYKWFDSWARRRAGPHPCSRCLCQARVPRAAF
jgi:hypothetical protein